MLTGTLIPMNPRDPDAHLVAGCATFSTLAIVLFAMATAPFLINQDSYLLAVLGKNLLLGLLPAWIIGILCTRKFNLPGAGGLVASSLTFAVFFLLRHWPFTMVEGRDERLPQLDYPALWVYLIPVAICIAAFVLAGLFLPKTELDPP